MAAEQGPSWPSRDGELSWSSPGRQEHPEVRVRSRDTCLDLYMQEKPRGCGRRGGVAGLRAESEGKLMRGSRGTRAPGKVGGRFWGAEASCGDGAEAPSTVAAGSTAGPGAPPGSESCGGEGARGRADPGPLPLLRREGRDRPGAPGPTGVEVAGGARSGRWRCSAAPAETETVFWMVQRGADCGLSALGLGFGGGHVCLAPPYRREGALRAAGEQKRQNSKHGFRRRPSPHLSRVA